MSPDPGVTRWERVLTILVLLPVILAEELGTWQG